MIILHNGVKYFIEDHSTIDLFKTRYGLYDEDIENIRTKYLLSIKNKEAQELILSKYSYAKQLNTLRIGKKNSIQVMSIYIDGIREELKKNGANADFERFK